LAKLSNDELRDLANGGHQAFVGCFKKGIKDHVRVAGAALNVLKKRIGQHGSWMDWLKENFKGSPETARLYMRVAREWRFVTKHGLDRLEGTTLEDIRQVLSDPEKRKVKLPKPTKTKATKEQKKTKDPDDDEQVEAVPLAFTEEDKEEYETLVDKLGEVFQTKTEPETVLEALRRCSKEVHDACPV